jgi:hypothetical protein
MKLALRIAPMGHHVPLSVESFAQDARVPLIHNIGAYGVKIHCLVDFFRKTSAGEVRFD